MNSNPIKINTTSKQFEQMSEALPTVFFLTFSGGLQDAYTYCTRGEVFANAQTGNIILMSQELFSGNWRGALLYLIPIIAFAGGIFAANCIRREFQTVPAVHWRQVVVLCEIVLLFLVGFLPHSLDFLANVFVSFSCAMQVQAFRKVNGLAYASTMCTGNLRSAVETLDEYFETKNPLLLNKAFQYFIVILIFAFGAGCGSVISPLIDIPAIWISCSLLLISFFLMFIKSNRENNAQP